MHWIGETINAPHLSLVPALVPAMGAGGDLRGLAGEWNQ